MLPAGGRLPTEFARRAGTDVKALISFQGTSILRRTIEELAGVAAGGRILVIGPPGAQAEARAAGAEAIDEAATGPQNLLRGLEWLEERRGSHAPRVLIATTDLPFLATAHVEWFLDACPRECDVAVPVVTRRAFENCFPDVHGEYVPLREGEMTIGCVFLVNPHTLMRNRYHLERVFEARKSQWRMAALMGPRVIWRFATRRLAIKDLLARAERVLRCRGAAILDAPPELAYDIDLPEDLEYACRRAAGGQLTGERPE